VRVGVIGCGAAARRLHVPALVAAGARVTAFASRSVASAERARDEAGAGVVCADWRELLARDDVDAVTICTPNALHAEQAVAAIESGRPVLVEKPVTVTVAEADKVIAASEAAGVVAMTAHSARFSPSVVALKEALPRIGLPTSVDVTFCHAGPAAWSADATWFTDPSLAGGGALLDLGVHVVDSLRWLLDDEVAEVTGRLTGGVVEQDAVVAFTTVAGAVGTLHAGWRSVSGPRVSFTVYGEQGTLVLDDRGAALHLPAQDVQPLPLPPVVGSPARAFVDAVERGATPSPDLHDGRAAVAFVQAAYRSAAERRTVALAELS
jgi:UDP-N-acetylglucosamine 3-dehydrogenase